MIPIRRIFSFQYVTTQEVIQDSTASDYFHIIVITASLPLFGKFTKIHRVDVINKNQKVINVRLQILVFVIEFYI